MSTTKIQPKQLIGGGQLKIRTISGGGWFRIAKISAGSSVRGGAIFNIMDFTAGRHQSLMVWVGAYFGNESGCDIQVVGNGAYQRNFSAVRVVAGDTYDDMYLEVWVLNTGTNTVACTMVDNFITSGWELIDWQTGSLPSGYTETILEIYGKNNHAPRKFLFYDTASRSFGTGWGSAKDTGNVYINHGYDVMVDIDTPVRNDDASWGGGYFQLYIAINGGGWQDTGQSGYHLAMAYGSDSTGNIIHNYTKKLVFKRGEYGIPSHGRFQFRCLTRYRSYNGTLYVNQSSGTGSTKYLSQIVISEVKIQN